jgi:ubiquinone/menaquinone biosynthesis C-methylase UbiE
MRMQHKWVYPDEASRRNWQNPEAILGETGVKAGFIFADVGCGDGFFSLPAARIVGNTGKVYCVDSNPEAIARLKQKAAAGGLNNILAMEDEAENAALCEECADIVFFGIVLHDFRDPAAVLVNARKTLKPGGRLANLDWKKEEMAMGPALAKRFDENRASEMITAAGFSIEAVKNAGPYHYLILAKRAG